MLYIIYYNIYFIFSPNECPGLCQKRQGYSLVKKYENILGTYSHCDVSI